MTTRPLKNLNKVQVRLVEAFIKAMKANGADRCILCAPTGTGKTGTARAIINRYAVTGTNKVGIFLTPRIGLTDQQARALLNFNVADLGFSDCVVDVLVVHSKIVESKKTTEFLKERIEENRSNGIFTIIACTYDSAIKLTRISVDVIICDEAHYVCEPKFHETVMHRLDQVAHRVFMTATPKECVGENNLGFNNIEMFGPYADPVAPRFAIENKIIVAPRIHVFSTWSRADKRFTVVDQVKEVFEYHKNYNGDRLPTKVLFAMSDTKDVGATCENSISLSEETGAKVFTIVSTGPFEGQYVNGVEVRDRNEFLDMISNYEGDAIVCHYAMLSVGIDVDGFTGVCFMRRPNKTVTIQTVGRALRIFKLDRQEDGYAKDYEYRVKKDALVTLVVYNGDTSLRTELTEFVRNIRRGGFNFFKDSILESSSKGYGDDTNQLVGSMVNKKKKKNPPKPYRHVAQIVLDEVQHQLELEELAAPAEKEREQAIQNLEAVSFTDADFY